MTITAFLQLMILRGGPLSPAAGGGHRHSCADI